jgi:phage baseplate assembly protein W
VNDFIGTGWAFPIKTDGRGGMELVSGAEEIRQAVWIILSTPVGQRVMRPTFGSQLHSLVFAPTNAETFGLAEMYVQEALAFWEPRIEVLDVNAGRDPDRDNVMRIEIRYLIKSSHDERSLVYPFYQIPGER